MNYKSQPFPPTSRYANLPLGVYQPQPDGPAFVYVTRRFLPSPSQFATLTQYTVGQGDRLDNVTGACLGDPEQFWRLCDANNAMRPGELVETPGSQLNITLPQGVTGTAL